MERLYTCDVSVSYGTIKCPIGKSFFVENFPLKFFRATVAIADTGGSKSFKTLFDTYLDLMQAKVEPNRQSGNVQF